MKKRNRNRNHIPAPAQSPLTKADIARSNGAKSHGPTSEAGKARSSQNAIKHGLCAKNFLGTPSEQAEFNQHLDAAIAHWAPQSDYELYLVTKSLAPTSSMIAPRISWSLSSISKPISSAQRSSACSRS